jgi:hypothetical protein
VLVMDGRKTLGTKSCLWRHGSITRLSVVKDMYGT